MLQRITDRNRTSMPVQLSNGGLKRNILESLHHYEIREIGVWAYTHCTFVWYG